jgi:hypothetical protein
MRSRALLVAAAIVLLSISPRGQTRTADGVDAFLRGEYARAAEILKPLAETPWAPDHTAAFFMAALYEGGLGVAADPLRACALFIRSMTDHTSPLGTAAMSLIRGYQRKLGQDGFGTCNWRATAGFDDRFEPVTLALDQEHWIAWDPKGATISYRGVDKRFEMPLVSRWVRFIAIRHTELAGDRSLTSRRHFVDVSWWAPLAQPRTWALSWTLFEVVRDQLISVATKQLTTATGDEPPVWTAQDLSPLVSLRVNETGDAEYAVLAGAAPQTAVIETDAERQASKQLTAQLAAQEARARKTISDAEARRLLDVRRPPILAYAAGDNDGCGSVFVYGWTGDRTEAISVRADKEPLQIVSAGTFDLATPRAGLQVQLHVYERAMPSFPFCTDVGVSGLIEEVWRPTRGTVTIELSPAGLAGRRPGLPRATIHISGAQFVNSSGVRIDQTQPITLTAIVGRFFG